MAVAALAIGVAADNESINDLDDLAGKSIATRLGSTSADFIKSHDRS